MIAAEAVMRGEPNSVVSQFATKPSGAMLELSGSVLPPKLGDGQDDWNLAASSLPANCTVNEPVPRRLTTGLELHALAAARRGRERRVGKHQRRATACRLLPHGFETGHPLLLGAVDHDVVGRAQAGQICGGAECDRCLAPDETPVLVGDEVAQPCLGRHDECAGHVDLGVVDGRLEQAALALLRIERRGEIEPRRRDLDILARPIAGLIRDHQRRAVEVLLRSPVAGEFLPHAVLPRFAFLDQVGDEQVRQDGGDRDAADQHDLVERERNVVGWRGKRDRLRWLGLRAERAGARIARLVSHRGFLCWRIHSAATSRAPKRRSRVWKSRTAARRSPGPKSGQQVSTKQSSA